MTAAVVIGVLFVLIVVGVVWARVAAVRSDRRSMETYGRALGVLGDVSRRTGPGPSVRVLPRSETGKGHVRPSEPEATSSSAGRRPPEPAGRPDRSDRSDRPYRPERRPPATTGRQRDPSGDGSGRSRPGVGDELPAAPPRPRISARPVGQPFDRPAASTEEPVRAARPPVRPSQRPSTSIPVPPGELSFEDRGEQWEGAGRPALRDPGERAAARNRRPVEPAGVSPDRQPADRPRQSRQRPGSSSRRPVDVDPTGDGVPQPLSADELRRQAALRRRAVGAAAVAAVLLITLAAVRLEGSPPKTSTAPTTTRPRTVTTTTSKHAVIPTTTTKSTRLEPISNDDGYVTYNAPSGSYELSFAAQGGACWTGVETGPGTDDFIWSQTVEPGAPATYKATGSVALDFGAIGYISVTLNGTPVSIPSTGVTGLVFMTS